MTNTVNNEPSDVLVEEREGISAVWLIPAIALIFGAWLLYKAVSNQGIEVSIQFDSASGIVAGKTAVRYKGLTVGSVTKVEVAEDLKTVNVEVEMIPSADNMLTEKTLFWYVTADISFKGVKGLDTLLSGSYINIQPFVGEDADSQYEFVALADEPEIDEDLPGLHIILQTDTLGSLGKDSPVTFKQIPVGYVQSFKYNDVDNKVDVKVYVKPEHAYLVKENSRFWNASGIEFNASLNAGVQIKTDSLSSIIVGGIAFDNAEYDIVLPPAESGQKYELHPDFQTAEMGHAISLELDWNSGVDVGATIMYQGLTLGRITSFSDIDPEKRKIIAVAAINPRAIPYLTEGTEFYVVSPQLDLTGISNVRTLVLGSHIGVRFSLTGEEQSKFVVYNQKPAYKYSEPGVHLVLSTTELGSLSVGSGIFYQQQQVGNIQAIENTGPDAFLIHMFIKPEFQNYVSKDSRFWNVSGFKIAGGLQNFEIQAQSIQSILRGGISFDKGMSDPLIKAENGQQFVLFDSVERAKQRLEIELNLPNVKGVSTGTRILLRGDEIGSVHNVERKQNSLRLLVGVLPEYEYVLKENSQFWLVQPQVSLSGLTDTDALFGGSYIGINVGEGDLKKSFVVSLDPPAKHHSSEGLQLTLNAASGNVVNPGSLISYRGITVGEVDNVTLDQTTGKVDINITVDERYKDLINGFTRFYNASGVTVSGGLSNFIVKTDSVDSMLKGGISFYNPADQEKSIEVEEGDKFFVHANEVHARKAGQPITIHFENVAGLRANMKIQYQEHEVGLITRLRFDTDDYGVTAIAYLNEVGRKLAVEGSQFWFEETEVGLVGTKNIGAIIDGGFISVLPGVIDGKKTTEFYAHQRAPVTKQLTYGLNVKLNALHRGSVRVGNPVLFRQLPVGTVIGVDLSPSANSVEVYINIDERFAPLVRPNSQFWNTSGFNLEAGVFSGVKIDSESVETLLAGGIAFATPEVDLDDDNYKALVTPVGQLHEFTLHDNLDEDWLEWRPQIKIAEY